MWITQVLHLLKNEKSPGFHVGILPTLLMGSHVVPQEKQRWATEAGHSKGTVTGFKSFSRCHKHTSPLWTTAHSKSNQLFFFSNSFVSCTHATPLHKCYRIQFIIKFRAHGLVLPLFFVLFKAHTFCFHSLNRTSCVYPPSDILLASLHMTEQANSSSTLIGKQNPPL